MQCHIIQSSPAVLITLISHTNGQGAVGDFDTGDGGILPVGIGGEHKRHCQLLAVYSSMEASAARSPPCEKADNS